MPVTLPSSLLLIHKIFSPRSFPALKRFFYGLIWLWMSFGANNSTKTHKPLILLLLRVLNRFWTGFGSFLETIENTSSLSFEQVLVHLFKTKIALNGTGDFNKINLIQLTKYKWNNVYFPSFCWFCTGRFNFTFYSTIYFTINS